jgi:uncharacterized membrane protein (TIGR02234 family)
VTDRRGLVVALLVGLAAGGLALLGASQPWARVEIAVPGVPLSTIETTGTSAVPWVGALALVVIAGTLAVIPTGRTFRRVVGGVVLLAAAGAAIGVLTAGPAIDDALAEDVAESPASGGVDDAAVVDAAERPAWRWLSLGASLVGVAAGALVVYQGHRWPTMGSRYDAPAGRRSRRPAGSDSVADADQSDADLWKAMDEGRDPTA